MAHPLIDILCCPVTHRPLKPAPRALLGRVNAVIAAGDLRRHDGEPLRAEIREGLVTDDERTLYRVDDGIPVLLEDEAIALAQLD